MTTRAFGGSRPQTGATVGSETRIVLGKPLLRNRRMASRTPRGDVVTAPPDRHTTATLLCPIRQF